MAKVDVKGLEDAAQTMRRASLLAERMGRLLCDEEVAEVAIAAAMLTSGIVECYAEDLFEARSLLEVIRGIEDRMVSAALGVKGLGLN